MERYTIYCTEEQVKKALKLGALIEVETILASDYETSRDNKVHVSEHLAKSAPYQEYAIIPTAEQMIGWLEEQYFNEIHVEQNARKTWSYIMYDKKDNCIDEQYGYTTRKEATLAAIDVALDYLIKVKEE